MINSKRKKNSRNPDKTLAGASGASSKNPSPSLDQDFEGMAEMRKKIRNHLKGIKSKIKATANAISLFEKNQSSWRESVKKRDEIWDRDISEVLVRLHSLLGDIDAHTAEAVSKRSELKRRLHTIKDMAMSEINRFESRWRRKYDKFAEDVTTEVQTICTILEQHSNGSLKNLKGEENQKDEKRTDPRINRSDVKAPLTTSRRAFNLKKSSTAFSKTVNESEEFVRQEAGDLHDVPFEPECDIHSTISHRLRSKLRSLNLPPGVRKISDSEYMKKITQVRKDLEQLQFDRSYSKHGELGENISSETQVDRKKRRENVFLPKIAFLPNFSANRNFSRKVKSGSRTECKSIERNRARDEQSSNRIDGSSHQKKLRGRLKCHESDRITYAEYDELSSGLHPHPQIEASELLESKSSWLSINIGDSNASNEDEKHTEEVVRRQTGTSIKEQITSSPSLAFTSNSYSKLQNRNNKKRLTSSVEEMRQSDTPESDQQGQGECPVSCVTLCHVNENESSIVLHRSKSDIEKAMMVSSVKPENSGETTHEDSGSSEEDFSDQTPLNSIEKLEEERKYRNKLKSGRKFIQSFEIDDLKESGDHAVSSGTIKNFVDVPRLQGAEAIVKSYSKLEARLFEMPESIADLKDSNFEEINL